MATLSMKIDDLERIARVYPDAGPIVIGQLDYAMKRSMAELERVMKDEAPAASGNLRVSIDNGVTPIVGGVRGQAGTSKNYAGWVVSGRRPGSMPPIQPIADWVKVKNRYSQIFSIDSDNEKDVLRVAYQVARAIARRGIPPNPFLERAATKALPKIEAEFNVVPKRIIAKVTGGRP